MDHGSVSRRSFIKSSAAAAVAIAASPAVLATRAAAPSENSRLRLGFIGLGERCQTHLDSAIQLQNDPGTVEIAAVCDVFNRRRTEAMKKISDGTKAAPKEVADFRDIINDPSIDAVCIATPDHWHAKQTLDALQAGKHVYCEKPMTHTLDEAFNVLNAWKKSGLVMQVGVQSTELPVWQDAHRRICEGQLGKVLQYQTEFFRNSSMGQWRYYELSPDMTPQNIDWKMFLGTEFGLAPDMPFDRTSSLNGDAIGTSVRGCSRTYSSTERRRCCWPRACDIRRVSWEPVVCTSSTMAVMSPTLPQWSPTSLRACRAW